MLLNHVFFIPEVLLRPLKAWILLSANSEHRGPHVFLQRLPYLLLMEIIQANMFSAIIQKGRTPALVGPSPFSGPWTCSDVDGLPPSSHPHPRLMSFGAGELVMG